MENGPLSTAPSPGEVLATAASLDVQLPLETLVPATPIETVPQDCQRSAGLGLRAVALCSPSSPGGIQ